MAYDVHHSDSDAEAWRVAFVRAHGREPEIVPAYENGWFVWRTPSGWVTHRERRIGLQGITKILEARACQVCSPEPKD